MPQKTTILKHEDPSKETWTNSLNLSKDENFAIKLKAGNLGTFSLGKLKSKAGTKGFGISFKKEF